MAGEGEGGQRDRGQSRRRLRPDQTWNGLCQRQSRHHRHHNRHRRSHRSHRRRHRSIHRRHRQSATAATDPIRHRRHRITSAATTTATAALRSGIEIHEGDCLSVLDFQTEASGLAKKYRDNDLSFAKQWGLNAVNADWAYANVELLKGQTAKPGAGVTIGFIDTGIDKNHPMFAGKTVSEVFLDGATNETGDKFSHGTAVASIAAGLRSGSLTSSANGVAWGADIAMFAVRAGSASGNYSPISLAGLSSVDSLWEGLINSVLNWRDGRRAVDFLNLSVGYPGIIDSYRRQELRANFGKAIDAIAQTGRAEKTILIWAAGNAHGDPCDPAVVAQCENQSQRGVGGGDAGLAARIAELGAIPSPWWRCNRVILQSLRDRRRLLPRGPRGRGHARLLSAPARSTVRSLTDTGEPGRAEGPPMPRPWSRAGWR